MDIKRITITPRDIGKLMIEALDDSSFMVMVVDAADLIVLPDDLGGGTARVTKKTNAPCPCGCGMVDAYVTTAPAPAPGGGVVASLACPTNNMFYWCRYVHDDAAPDTKASETEE